VQLGIPHGNLPTKVSEAPIRFAFWGLLQFVTETHPNTFSVPPEREDVDVFVWFSLFANRTARDEHAKAFADLMPERQLAAGLSMLIEGQPRDSGARPAAHLLLPLSSNANIVRRIIH
jgi:hypothetical protein